MNDAACTKAENKISESGLVGELCVLTQPYPPLQSVQNRTMFLLKYFKFHEISSKLLKIFSSL